MEGSNKINGDEGLGAQETCGYDARLSDKVTEEGNIYMLTT